MIPLPPCRWRGERRQDRYVCESVKFLDPPNLVRAEDCAGCFFVDHAPPLPLPPALPCVHLGAAASADAFSCAEHGLCAPARCDDVPGARCCARCPDYLARDPFGPSSGEMRQRADEHLAALENYPTTRYRGRGIVLAGGGPYFPSLYVTVRALRHLGSQLPIQVWHLGAQELPARWQALLAPYGVECVDAQTVRQRHPARRLGGWELKVFATLHSPFEEALFLDADCYPCRPPDFLFDLEDYRAAGAIFWSDVATTDLRLRWAAFGVASPRRPGSIESGQYVVNKRLCWRPLNLAWFYNDHSDYYYQYGYGDKHTFEVAWARCGPPFVLWQPQASWAEVAYLHPGPDGLPLFVHRCADKFRWMAGPFSTPQAYSGPAFCPHLPLERECWGWLADLTTAAGPGSRGGNALVPEKVVRIGLPGHFNCSLVQHEGLLLLASRDRETGAGVALSELGPDYQPRWTRRLSIVHPRASAACEDPRLFFFGGQLHCAFIGVEHDGRDWHVHQMVCRLGDDGEVEEVWLPEYAARTVQEKNWQFFEHEGELYSVYTVSPHVVLRHRGGKAEKVAHTAARLAWPGCHLRGGAPPVRVGDERYHFFHCVKERDGQKEYSTGVYTFAARPPFEMCRAAETPILLPDEHDRPPGLVSVVFPCGALLRDGQWIISYGYQDRECRIAVFAAEEIEKRLRPV